MVRIRLIESRVKHFFRKNREEFESRCVRLVEASGATIHADGASSDEAASVNNQAEMVENI
jgi:hypothetical protein